MLRRIWTAIILDNNDVGRFVVLAIAIMLLVALFYWWKHWSRLGLEISKIKTARTKLREIRKKKSSSEDKKNINERQGIASVLSVDELRRFMRGFDTTLIGERLDTIYTLRLHRVKFTTQTLQNLTEVSEESKGGMSVPGLIAGLVILLGIVGTFFGLQELLSVLKEPLATIQDEIASNHYRQNRLDGPFEQLSKALGSMATAFSTSIMGMVVSIVASLLQTSLNQRQALCFQELESFTTRDLIPATMPRLEDDSMLETLHDQMDRILGQYEEAADKNREILHEISKTEQGLIPILEQFNAITKKDTSHSLQLVINEVVENNANLSSMLARMDKQLEIISKSTLFEFFHHPRIVGSAIALIIIIFIISKF